VRSSFGTDFSSFCGSCFGSSLGASAFFDAGLSSAGISSELRSSPGSAVTPIRLPTCTCFEPSPCCGDF
jgi:hypothetical protein